MIFEHIFWCIVISKLSSTVILNNLTCGWDKKDYSTVTGANNKKIVSKIVKWVKKSLFHELYYIMIYSNSADEYF